MGKKHLMIGGASALTFACLWATCSPAIAQEKTETKPADKAIAENVLTFEKATPDATPSGFTEALTAGGGPVKWHVVETKDAPSGKYVVAQLSNDATDSRYPLLILDDFSARDVDVSVKFKAISGKVDQAAGIVWRLQDKDNYYIARANALENNVVIYKTVAGKRSSIGIKSDPKAYGVKTEVLANKWNTLRVRMVRNLAEVFLNDVRIIEVENDSFQDPGKIGLWTKADSVTYFDDLQMTSIDESAAKKAEDNVDK